MAQDNPVLVGAILLSSWVLLLRLNASCKDIPPIVYFRGPGSKHAGYGAKPNLKFLYRLIGLTYRGIIFAGVP